MLTEKQIEVLGDKLTPLYQKLEQEIIADIARRVKKTGRYTETAELMVKSLMNQGFSPQKIQSEVMKLIRADKDYQMFVAENTKEYKEYIAAEVKGIVEQAKEQGNEVIASAGNMSFNNDLSMWRQAGKTLTEGDELHQIVNAMALQTNKELRNLTKTMGFKNTGFSALKDVYQNQLDLGLVKLTGGAYSWQQVVNDCVHNLAQSGLRTIDYKSGRSMQLDTAVRNCIRTASAQLSGKVTIMNIEKTEGALVEVSSHWGARSDGSCGQSDHAYWQGKVYALDNGNHAKESRRLGYVIRNLEDVTGYPNNPAGLLGYNCRHMMYPFFEGISEPNQWEPEPGPVTVNGRKYDYYHATQKQRQMERQIRATKREIEAQKVLGGDTKELQSRLRKQIADYKRFSADVDIRPKNERLRVVPGSSDLNKTKTMKWISDQYRGYTASIPKTWEKIEFVDGEKLLGTNPKFIANPLPYDKQAIKYSNNCVNSTIAYEMRCRDYKVIAGKSNSVLRNKPELAWENIEPITFNKVAFDEIEQQMKEWGDGARACICLKNIENNRGHAIVVENVNGKIEFLDVQKGKYYNKKEAEILGYNDTLFFRIDNATISTRGINACEKE